MNSAFLRLGTTGLRSADEFDRGKLSLTGAMQELSLTLRNNGFLPS